MPQDNTFDGNGRCRDGLATDQGCERPKREPTQAAKVKAPATPDAASGHFRSEYVSVLALVGKEVSQLGKHFRCTPAGDPVLRPVDIDCAMLPCMVDFQDTIAEGSQGELCVHR